MSFDSSIPSARIINIIGQEYGFLKVLAFAEMRFRRAYWLCQCRCGTHKIISGLNMRNGTTKSCGCYADALLTKRNTRHGMAKSKIYHVWIQMLQRCNNPHNRDYKNYGGRGIRVCEAWHTFQNFFNDIGNPPFSGATLDRRDNDQGYSPNNVRWATQEQQANNTRTNQLLTYDDETLTLAQWSRKLNMPYKVLGRRLRLGWSIEETFTTPLLTTGQRLRLRR